MSEPITLPTIVIGAGPVGMTAAAHLLVRDLDPLVLEAGERDAASLRDWGHVRLFSPWEWITDPVAVELLEADGWTAPDDDAYPTGAELADRYVAPLAQLPALRDRVRYGARVIAVTKLGVDKLKDAGRDEAPFEVIVDTDGRQERLLARAVIDASGTWTSPNPLGAGGLPAAGEAAHAGRIAYRIPDILGADRDRYAGRRVLVIGSGHSALNALLDLAALHDSDPATEIVWAVRRPSLGNALGGGADDQLPARGALGSSVGGLLQSGAIELVTGFQTLEVADAGGRLELRDGTRAISADEVIATTGFRPELAMLRELRLDLDDRVEAARALAPMIDPNHHSCGSVPPHGVDELSHPDAGIHIVGMKSYGRAPTFLLRTGYEQVRSIVAALAGDWEAARRVELVLPETGVCSVTPDRGGGVTSACCGTAPAAPETITPIAIETVAAAPAESAACCGIPASEQDPAQIA